MKFSNSFSGVVKLYLTNTLNQLEYQEEMEWFNKIEEVHNATFKTIEMAITLEEQEKPTEAIEKYKESIASIDGAMNICVPAPRDTDDEVWDKAYDMVQKLKKSRAEVLTRINCLKAKHANPVPSSSGVNCEAQPQGSGTLTTYAELAEALNSIDVDSLNKSDVYIIFTVDDASIYYINNQGIVTRPSQTEKLILYGTEGDIPNKFLKIGDWIYPLVPGVSPCFKTKYNAFIFPDIHSNLQIGIILSKDEAEIFYDLLTNFLHGVIIEKAEPEPEQPIDEQISAKIVAGAKYLAEGLVSSSSRIGRFLDETTPRHIASTPSTTDTVSVPPNLQKALKIADAATSTTAHVAGYLAEKIGFATSKLGQYLAPHIQTQGTRLLQSTMNYSEEEASQKVKSILTVTGGAVEGFSTVYSGLEVAGAILGNSIKENTVKVVQSKYGSPAGDAALNTFNTVGNVYAINCAYRRCTPSGVVKQTAKNTGKAVVKTDDPK